MKNALIVTMVIGIMALGYNNYMQGLQIRQLQDVSCAVSKEQAERFAAIEGGMTKLNADNNAGHAELNGAIGKIGTENDTAHGELAASILNTAIETAVANSKQQYAIEQIVSEMLLIYERNHSNIMEWR